MSVKSPNSRAMSPPPIYENHAPGQLSSSTLKPYLQLPHLLSLTWLAYPILSLVFVVFRLQVSSASSQDAVAGAKDDMLTGCKAAETAATAAASMPRYMAVATNQQFADAVNGSMNAARATLVLSLTVMEAIINFIVDIYRSTFLCFVELVVRGGLSILISAVQELNTFVQGAASSIKSGIQNDISAANSAIQSAVSAFNKINPFGDVSVPQFSIPSLSGLDNITLPTDFENALVQLNSSLPTFTELKDVVENFLDTPFELLKQDINETFGNLSFDASVLPVPQQNFLTFCDNLDTSVVDDLGNDLLKITKIGTVILALVALLLLGAHCALEWYKWRCQQRHLEYTRQAWLSDPTMYHSGLSSAPRITLTDHNLLMLQANGAHPLLTRLANTLAARLRLSPSQHTHLQWFFHYVFHPPALACFLIGFFGLLSVQIQLFAISPLAAKFSDRAAASATDLSTTIATSVNNSMFNQSSAYANDVNARVDLIQSTINNGVFGWVNGTTTTLNTTINNFYDDIQDVVSKVFNGTILEQPAQEFIRCIIGSKVDAIENALTFLHDNLHVDMPRVNQTVLMLSPAEVNEATQPIAAAAIGGGPGDSTGLVGRLLNTYEESLRKERLMFAIFIGLWGFVVLMALAIIFWHSYVRGWVEAYRRRKWQRTQRAGIDGLVIPFRGDNVSSSTVQRAGSTGGVELPDLTPLPSPKGFTFFNRAPSPQPKAEPAQPEREKSWDSFFGPKQAPPPVISKPMELMSYARAKEMAQDAEKANGASREVPGWLRRIRGLFAKQDSEEPAAPSTTAPLPRRVPPKLTIAVDRASTAQPQPQPQLEQPQSAWSISPTASRLSLPWMQQILPTRRQTPPPSPGPRARPNVPSDVDSVFGDGDRRPLIAKFAPPLHHGLGANPPGLAPAPRRFLAPPPDRRRRSSSVPVPASPGRLDNATPVTRLLTTTHARQSSSVDPFVTPFDDEHRVEPSTNPFAAVAL